MLRSCGIADLIATSYAGRNRKCAMEFHNRCVNMTKERTQSEVREEKLEEEILHSLAEKEKHLKVQELWLAIEKDLLNGQKLQGVSTCYEVMDYLSSSGYLRLHSEKFPLMRCIHKIISTGEHFDSLYSYNNDIPVANR
jgi:glycerol-3-phosphate dehydrogenase